MLSEQEKLTSKAIAFWQNKCREVEKQLVTAQKENAILKREVQHSIGIIDRLRTENKALATGTKNTIMQQIDNLIYSAGMQP